MSKSERFVISLGGSIIAPQEGFDIEFLKSLRGFFVKQAEAGRRFVLVVGGGAVARKYMEAADAVTEVSDDQKDWIGIRSTILNATLMQSILGEMAHGEVVTDPRVRLETERPIIMAAGWKPGFSTDMDAVMLASGFGAETVINLSNISHVYDSNPRENPDANKIEEMSWADFSAMFGTEWSPGLNAPFDPIAALEADKNGMRVCIADGRDLDNLNKIIEGEQFEGTVLR